MASNIKIDNLQLQAINEYWRREMGRNNISCDVNFSDLISYNLVDPSIGGFMEGSSHTVVYVDGIRGSDRGDGSSLSPFKTISRACNEIPLKTEKNITIKVKAGSYDENVTVITAIYGDYEVIIEGIDFVPATIASGVLGGTIAVVDTKFITRISAGWTSGDLAEKYIRFTSGSQSGNVFYIVNNTSDTIELQSSVSGLVGATFELIDTAVLVQDNIYQPKTFDITVIGGTGNCIVRNMKTFSGSPIEYSVGLSNEIIESGGLRTLDLRNTSTSGVTSVGCRGFAGALFSEFGYGNPTYVIPSLQNKVFLGYYSGRDLIFTNSSASGAATAKGLGNGDWNFDPSNNTLYVDSVNHKVGIGTASPTSKLTVTGAIQSTSNGFKFPDNTIQSSASFTNLRRPAFSTNIEANDDTIIVVNNSEAVTLTLPLASTVTSGRKFYIKDGGNGSSHTITIIRSGSDTIDGAESVSITTSYGLVVLVCDGVDRYYKLM